MLSSQRKHFFDGHHCAGVFRLSSNNASPPYTQKSRLLLMSDNSAYLSLFLEEANENLEQLNQSLLQLENTPGDKNILNEIFRVAHTLKGMAAAMGYEGFKELTHAMEDVLGAFKNDELKQRPEDCDVLFQCLDALTSDLGLIEQDTYQNDRHDELYNALKTRFAGGEYEEQAPAELQALQQEIAASTENAIDPALALWQRQILGASDLPENETIYCVTVKLEPNTPLPAVRGFMVQQALEGQEGCEIKSSFPQLTEESMGTIESDTFHWILAGSDLENPDEIEEIKQLILKVSQVEEVGIQALTAERTEQLDVIETELAQEVTQAVVSEHSGQITEMPINTSKAPTAPSKPANGDNTASSSAKTVRIPMDRIDHLVDLMGELVISRTRMFEFANRTNAKELITILHAQSVITNELQELVMKFRMEPIEKMFSRFPRVVRDLAKTLGKQVEVTMSGEDTEVDRMVNEELGGALIHLIRNAIDHGIEATGEDRIKAGKAVAGRVHLAAANSGDSIIINISDDGRGLNRDAIVAKAIKNGLLTEDRANQLPDNEVNELIFLPGFSTAQVTTDVSGRGVGMDVVKNTVDKLGGHIEITSRAGQGSNFKITLPTSMAITNVLLVAIEQETYALPIACVKEIVELPKQEVRQVNNIEVMMVRGEPLPLIRLKNLVGMENRLQDSDTVLAVVIRLNEQFYCLQVDTMIGQQEAVVKPPPALVTNNSLYSGVTILGNGNIVLILNPSSLVKHTNNIQPTATVQNYTNTANNETAQPKPALASNY